MSFRKCLEAGKAGEELVRARFEARPDVSRVDDVSSDPGFQAIGVDLVVCYVDARPDRWVDVKTDSHAPRNVFLETVANCDLGSPGCFLYTEATTWIVWYSNHGIALWLPIHAARAWFDEDAHPIARAFTKVGAGMYQTEGRIVPVADVIEGVEGAALVPFPADG